MKINRALVDPWFKHVPLPVLGSGKIHDLQPTAKTIKLSAENRNANVQREQQQLIVSYWSAQPRQNITSGLPYTAHNPQLARQHSSRPDPPYIESRQTTTAPTFSGHCFKAFELKRRNSRIIQHDTLKNEVGTFSV